LADILSDFEETFTLFAPTNDAFAALPDGLLTTLLTPRFHQYLFDILLYHVFADAAVLSADLLETQELEMLNGEMVTINKSDMGVVRQYREKKS
jgi:transforming growth factor-beta-induced protein